MLYPGPFGSPQLSLLHAETGHPAERATSVQLLDFIHDLNEKRSDEDPDTLAAPYILREAPAMFITELQNLHRRWWPQTDDIVVYVRFLILETWLSRLRDVGRQPDDEDLVLLAERTAPVFEPILLFYHVH